MSGIDSLFDLADAALDAFDRLSPEAPGRRPTAPSPATHASAAPPAGSTRSGSAGSGRRSVAIATSRFRVVDAIDAGTGAETWVVTDGRDRAECNSAEFARRVRVALG